MMALVKIFSILVFFLGCFTVFSTHSFAADDMGKMLLKTDRIGQDSTTGNENHKETELEKVAPDLFNEQTRAAINTKQLESEKATANLEQKLFVQPSEPSTSLKDTKNTLFSNNYTVQYAEVSTQDTKEDGGLISNRIIPALIGLVAACCGGTFVMMRKMLE